MTMLTDKQLQSAFFYANRYPYEEFLWEMANDAVYCQSCLEDISEYDIEQQIQYTGGYGCRINNTDRTCSTCGAQCIPKVKITDLRHIKRQ